MPVVAELSCAKSSCAKFLQSGNSQGGVLNFASIHICAQTRFTMYFDMEMSCLIDCRGGARAKLSQKPAVAMDSGF